MTGRRTTFTDTKERLMASRNVLLAHPVRTAIGTFNGTLKATPATDLGAIAVRETLRRSGLDSTRVGSVVMGNVVQAGNRMNPARQAAIGGGVPVSVPALTVNRVCGSGAQAIVSAAQEVLLGHVDAAIAGGMENMDRAPYLLPSGRSEEHTSELQSRENLVCRLLLEKKNKNSCTIRYAEKKKKKRNF